MKRPERKCTGCKQMKHKQELLRIVRADEAINIDETNKQDGRGAYVCKNIQCLEQAQKTKGFERSLKTKMPNDLYQQLHEKIQNETLKI